MLRAIACRPPRDWTGTLYMSNVENRKTCFALDSAAVCLFLTKRSGADADTAENQSGNDYSHADADAIVHRYRCSYGDGNPHSDA
jgi:hypothetical protein